MDKLKPYITGFVIGAIFMAMAGTTTIIAVKKTKPLIKKAISKAGDWRYRRVKKAKKDMTIADFETKRDLAKITPVDINIALSKEHPTSGKQCAKVLFKRSPAPALKISEYLERHRSLGNWAPYESFMFDVYNPNSNETRFILQIKDKRGERYKQTVRVGPNEIETVEVEIAALRQHISIYNIRQINLFQWRPNTDTLVFVDNLRLASARRVDTISIFDSQYAKSKEPPYAIGDYFAFPADRWRTEGGVNKFPVRVLNPSRIKLNNFPVTGGIPFPKGQLHDARRLTLTDGAGEIVPHQSRITARWEDGSIKWLLLNMPVSVEYASGAEYFVNYLMPGGHIQGPNIARDLKEGVTIDTGKIKLFIGREGFRLFDKVWLSGKEMVSKGGDLTIRFRNRTYRSSGDRNYNLTIETNGPLTSTIKAEGWFVDGRRRFCKFITRIKAYKDEDFVRVFHTFVYTGYPENKHHYLYQGKRLPKNETIQEVAIEIHEPQLNEDVILAFGADDKVYEKAVGKEKIAIFQTASDSFKAIKGSKSVIMEGSKLDGWLDISDSQRGIGVVVRKLWQHYPKSFSLDRQQDTLSLKLWPREAGELDLKTTERANGPEAVARGSAFGLAKTHELVFYFHQGDYKTAKIQNLSFISQKPPLIVASPEWISDSKVLGALSSSREGEKYFKKYEDVIERLFDWGYRQQRTFKWYGMINFGDVLTDYGSGHLDGALDETGWYRDGRHGWHNCSVMGLNLGCLAQFLRTGEYKYFEFGEDNTRHIIDIDTCHYNTIANDKRLNRRIPDDYSKVGSMHRHNADHWGGRNEMAGYTNLNGILLYYYLTGNERAFDVAKEVGEFFLERPVTYFKHPDIAPGRAVANVLWGNMVLYEATQDKRFREEANYWADVFFKGQNRNGSFGEDYNPVRRKWYGKPHLMYMSGYITQALIEYHKTTANKAIAESIVKLTNYLTKHNKYYPYFDGLSYSYYLTGNKEYLHEIEDRLAYFERSQRKQNDSLWNGMIFQKLTYTRMVYFGYSLPYAFEALLEQAKQTSAVASTDATEIMGTSIK